ncbi:ankyrin repeat domain-containing protein 65-like [Vitis riparia]|uniref:ankyrin repeat domain-containing protein 65-like n=1 Tax=Vitis riparia TaxID=96939 RepID=UPI00155A2BA5|nr:ankyrin repeat domain-containing protein 65-like [Vitis riparia]
MDRLVKPDVKEVEIIFKRGQKCNTTFRLTNLMHTMSVAVSLTTTNPSLFSFPQPFSILPPLSSSPFTLLLSQPSDHPPLSSPNDTLLVRTAMLPTGKAHQDDLRRLFSKPGPHVFKDAAIPIFLVGPHVVDFLLLPHPKTLEIAFLLSKAISGCNGSQLTSLLRSAVVAGNADLVEALIDAGGDVNSKDSDGRSMMGLAIRGGNIDVIRLLIISDCRIDNPVDLVLHEAAAINRVDLMEVLCKGYAEIGVNSADSDGRSPLHVAAAHGHVEVLRFCLSAGGTSDAVDCNGWTPLHCAAAEGHGEAAEFLLESSWYMKYVVNKEGKTAFDLAIEKGHGNGHLLDLLRLGDVLQRAARVDDVHGMKSCLAEGATVNGRDQNGWTPLHRAAFKGRLESVKLLLSHGAQVDLVDDAGYTPLHCAVETGHVQVALCLIAHGARATVKSLKGVASFNFDCFKNHPSLVLPVHREKEQA